MRVTDFTPTPLNYLILLTSEESGIITFNRLEDMYGVILKAGKDCSVEEGKTVYFEKEKVVRRTMDGVVYFFVPESSVLLTLEK